MTPLAELFPPETVALAADPADVRGELFDEERACIARAIDRRRREFAAGRILARRALGRLGAPAEPLLPDRDRVPRWPAGFVGCITHTGGFGGAPGYCAVVVARAADLAAVGLDAEPAEPLEERIAARVCTPRELEHLRSLGGDSLLLARLVFSAKEAFYKARYPATRHFLAFDEVEVELDLAERTFQARVLADGDTSPGAFRMEDGLILGASYERAAR